MHTNTHLGQRDNYLSQKWYNNNATLLELLHLGTSMYYISQFRKTGFNIPNATAVRLSLLPTLSPKDPNFDKWYKEVYEPRMKELQGK